MTVPPRPITRVLQMLEPLGLEVTHMYEDLVFVDRNAFLLRFEEKGENITLFFNADATPADRIPVLESVSTTGKTQGLTITCGGTFTMTQRDDEQIDIRFCGS